MMLHRHFENERNKNITKLEDVTPKKEYISEVFPPEEPVEAPKKRAGRPQKKTEE